MSTDGKTFSRRFTTPRQGGRPTRICARGTSLIEVLIALVLLVVGLGGVLQFYERLARQSARVGHRAQAVRLAENRLTRLQSLGYAQLKSRYLAGGGEAMAQGTESAEEEKAFWRWDARLRDATIEGLPPAIHISVEMQWVPERSGLPKAARADDSAPQKAVGYVVAQ